MGLAHCPLCIALALLSMVSSSAHVLQLWQLLARNPCAAPGLQAL